MADFNPCHNPDGQKHPLVERDGDPMSTNRSMRRLLVLLMSVGLVAAACSSDEDPGAADATTETTAAEATTTEAAAADSTPVVSTRESGMTVTVQELSLIHI